MRPYFVVRNSLFGIADGLDRKDRRATATFEALPGQDCAEGVFLAFPKRDNATDDAEDDSGSTEANTGKSRNDEIDANKQIAAPAITKVQLVQGEGGSLCLSFSLNDGTDLNIFDSKITSTTSNDGGSRPTSSTVFRIARAAYPHLLHFSRLTNHETNPLAKNPNDIYDDRNPSASEYMSIDSEHMEALSSSTVAVSIAVSTEPVRNARIYDGISFADIHGMLRTVQKEIPAARPDDGCLNLSQFLAFSCLLEQHVVNERDAAPRLSARILERSDSSVRIVVSSSNKACRITAKAYPREYANINNFGGSSEFHIEASIGIAKEKEGIVELDGLEENTEYRIVILGRCPMSKFFAQTTLIGRTKSSSDVGPNIYPSWSDMSRADQETELLAVVKDRAIRNLAAMGGISTDLVDLTSPKDNKITSMSGVGLASFFALWWCQNDRAREDFCLREARHASKDPIIRQLAEEEGIIIKSRDWKSSTTDVAAQRRRRRFCWWYYEIEPAKRDAKIGAAIHRHRDHGKGKEITTTPCKAPIPLSSLGFSPPPVSSQEEAGPVKSTQHTLPKRPQTYYKEPKRQALQPDNAFVATNRSDGADGNPVDERNEESEEDRHAPSNVDAVEGTLHAANSFTSGSDHFDLNVGYIPTPLKQDLAKTSIQGAVSNAESTKDTDVSQHAHSAESNDDANAELQGEKSDQDQPTISTKKADMPNTASRSISDSDLAIHHTGTIETSTPALTPSRRSKRSTFLGAKTAKTKKAVGEVDKMLSFQMNAKKLRGVALLKAKVRLMMITVRLQALREKSGCKDDAPALDHVDLFDEDDMEQSSQPKVEDNAPPTRMGADKENTRTTPSPSTSGASNKDSDSKNTKAQSLLALEKVTDIYKKTASRGVKVAYQVWKVNAEEQKKSEAHSLEGSDASVDGSLLDETSVSSASLNREEDEFHPKRESSNDGNENDVVELPEKDEIDASLSSLASGASIELSNCPLAVNVSPTHVCRSQYSTDERFDEASPTASEEAGNDTKKTACTCRKYCISLDEDMDNDNWINIASEYFVQNTNILNLLPAMAYSNGFGTRISKQEYETEYRDFIESSSAPLDLPNLRPRFAASE